MTDTEKRAHDLTILCMEARIKDGEVWWKNPNSTVRKYQDIFDSIIECFDRQK